MPVSDDSRAWVEQRFSESIVPTLERYIAIPNKSPAFDPAWRSAGHMQRAVDLLAGWAREAMPEGTTLEVVQLGERTPVIFLDVPATGGAEGDTVMLYGHLDKQPEMTGWREGLGPWTPVLEDDRLYGRGGADDGYAIFASLTALAALRRDGVPHARAVILIEACEESGSFDLPAYIEHLAPRIGELSLVVCLDSGCANYDQLWSTTSLRGLVVGTLEVSLLTEGVHSGDGSGVIASSFRVVRQLLERLEDSSTGAIRPEALYVPIPEERQAQARNAAGVLGDEVWQKFPLQPGADPEPHMAPRAFGHRCGRPAATCERWQRAAPGDAAQAVAARSAAPRCLARSRDREGTARERSAVRRQGQLQRGRRQQRLGCAAARGVARRCARSGIATALRKIRDVPG
jgi:acetylornithine deacetylase/succinyl-diaminopimelate desuccinylase-like protein